MKNRYKAAWSLSLFSLIAIGAGPPPEGTTVEGGIGVGTYEYQTGGCSSMNYTNRANHIDGHLGLTHRAKNGIAAGADVNATYDKNVQTESTDPIEVGREDVTVLVGARVGWHFEYAGAEIAALALIREGESTVVLPGGSVWAGAKELHAYLELFTGDLTITDRGIGSFGVGHQNDAFTLRGGLLPARNGEVQVEAVGKFHVNDDLWAGGQVHGNEDSIFGALTLSQTF